MFTALPSQIPLFYLLPTLTLPYSALSRLQPYLHLPTADNNPTLKTGSSGIGLGIVSHLLAHHASKIYLLSANPAHATTALEHLKAWGDVDAVVAWRKCDLRSFEDTKEAALGIRRELEKEGGLGRLDAVVANAGVGVGVYGETGDGLGEFSFSFGAFSPEVVGMSGLCCWFWTRVVLFCGALSTHRSPPQQTRPPPKSHRITSQPTH